MKTTYECSFERCEYFTYNYFFLTVIANQSLYSAEKNRQIKAALRLYDENDEEIEKYDKNELLLILQINSYHSLKQSNSEDEMRSKLVTEKKFLHVYNHP